MRTMMARVTVAAVALSMLGSVAPASGAVEGGCPGGYDLIKTHGWLQKRIDRKGNHDRHVCLGPNNQIRDNDTPQASS